MLKDYGCINNLLLFIFQTTSLDACSQIRERLSEIKGIGEAKLYGLFLTDDGQKGTWLEPSKTLEHYLLRDNVSSLHTLLEYIRLLNLLSNVKKSLEISSYFCGLLRIYELYLHLLPKVVQAVKK